MSRPLAILCAAAMATACTTGPKVYESGSSIPTNADASLQPGVSSVDDAIRQFGAPASRTTKENGTVLGYVRFVTEIASPYRVDSKTQSETVLLYFDAAGRYLRPVENQGSSQMKSR